MNAGNGTVLCTRRSLLDSTGLITLHTIPYMTPYLSLMILLTTLRSSVFLILSTNKSVFSVMWK